MEKHFFRRIPGLILLLTALCVGCAGADAVLTAENWTWEPGGEIRFTGSATAEGGAADATWRLVMETDPEAEPGSLFFTEINGKTLKMRRRSDTVQADFNGGEENTFAALWYLPEQTEDLSAVTIRFSVTNADGKELAAGFLNAGRENVPAGEGEGQLLTWMNRAILILFPLGALLWLAAILRNLQARRGNRRPPAETGKAE